MFVFNFVQSALLVHHLVHFHRALHVLSELRGGCSGVLNRATECFGFVCGVRLSKN